MSPGGEQEVGPKIRSLVSRQRRGELVINFKSRSVSEDLLKGAAFKADRNRHQKTPKN